MKIRIRRNAIIVTLSILFAISWFSRSSVCENRVNEPVRICIVGLVHGHAGGFLQSAANAKEIRIVGLSDPSVELHKKYARQFSLDENIFYEDVVKMLDDVKPQGVAIFASTFDHTRIVEFCAARGIHVMMEKPLAVSMEHARRIEKAARDGHIQVIVNYETTWYPSNHKTYSIVNEEKAIGDIRKIVVHDGHQGPKEINCPQEFLDWLTDPHLNGAGALFDFGCYGANLMTWLMHNQRPTSVTAVAQTIKPDVYPKVDDEATILVTYPHAQGIIQASWNWPFNRKDMEVYGRTGYVFADNHQDMRIRLEKQSEQTSIADPLSSPNDGSIPYFAAVIRGDMKPEGLSSLENNLIVTEILDAARQSVQTGKTIELK